jgi:hypothetical protein
VIEKSCLCYYCYRFDMRRTLNKTLLLIGFLAILLIPSSLVFSQSTQEGSVGVEGRISAPPPSTGATITVPSNGQEFTNIPITVAGLCPNGVLVKLFKNNIFSGSADCVNGSFSLLIDLFNGQNDLVARVFDDLDQAGPDSNTVSVTYNDPIDSQISRVALTSNFAKRGANPGQTLTWPIIISGGQGPYAISVDWGDGKDLELYSREFPGVFDIKHIYDNPGVYNVVIKAIDQNGSVAYLQLVAVANGPLSQDTIDAQKDSLDVDTRVRVLWQPAAFLILLIILAFWLGKRYQLKVIRTRLERGERPF